MSTTEASYTGPPSLGRSCMPPLLRCYSELTCTLAYARRASQENSSCIINTGSKQGITTPPGNAVYNVSKSAVKTLTEQCKSPSPARSMLFVLMAAIRSGTRATKHTRFEMHCSSVHVRPSRPLFPSRPNSPRPATAQPRMGPHRPPLPNAGETSGRVDGGTDGRVHA